MTEFPGLLTLYLAITGMLWAGFSVTERLLTPSALKQISGWLYGERVKGMASTWIAGFLAAFDRAFRVQRTKRGLPIPRFVRATGVSLAFVLILYGIAAVTEHLVYRSLWQHLVQLSRSEEFVEAAYFVDQLKLAAWVAGGLLIALLVDFISLTETRWVIDRIVLTESTAKILLWLFIDLCVTTLLALIGFACTWYAASFVIGYVSGGVLHLSPKLSFELAFGVLTSWLRNPHYIGTEIEKIFFYSAYFTSLWVWIFCLAGIALRAIYYVQPLKNVLAKHLRVGENPVTIAGWLAITVFSVVFWGSITLHAVFSV